MSHPLLLDEMFSETIASELRAAGHDVLAVVADLALVSLPDDQILAHAAATGRAVVTANIKDFMPLDTGYRAAGHSHAGLIVVSTKTFPKIAPLLRLSPKPWAPSSTKLVLCGQTRFSSFAVSEGARDS